MNTIKEAIMTRDNMTEDEAIELIGLARTALQEYLDDNDLENANNICMEYFGLEMDYIFDLI